MNNNNKIKDRLVEFLWKIMSIKFFWSVVVTIIFITTNKISSDLYLIFLASLIGINSLDKFIFNKFKDNN